MQKIISLVLFLWFSAVAAVAWRGGFVSAPGSPPLGLGLAFAVPMGAFFAIFFGIPAARRRLTEIPTALLASLHGWRFVGLGFIAVEARGLLPPGFAWPAGLGDIAVAALAPYIVLRLVRDENFRSGIAFTAWNILGIADFLVAVGLGVAYQVSPGTFHAAVDTRMMQELPFVLITCFFVPLLAMTHVVMFHQAWSERRSARLNFARLVQNTA